MIEAALLCLDVGISDGDTLKVRCSEQPQILVRLAEIDAAEKAKPYGQRSEKLLSVLCFKKQAKVLALTHDRYGRTVARVVCAGTDANAEMVRQGMSWAHTRYLIDLQIRAMEIIAWRERLGLWIDPHPMPPWERRKSSVDSGAGNAPSRPKR